MSNNRQNWQQNTVAAMSGLSGSCRACKLLRKVLIFPCVTIGLFYLGLRSGGDNAQLLILVSDLVTISNALAVLAIGLPLLLLVKFFLERKDKQ